MQAPKRFIHGLPRIPSPLHKARLAKWTHFSTVSFQAETSRGWHHHQNHQNYQKRKREGTEIRGAAFFVFFEGGAIQRYYPQRGHYKVADVLFTLFLPSGRRMDRAFRVSDYLLRQVFIAVAPLVISCLLCGLVIALNEAARKPENGGGGRKLRSQGRPAFYKTNVKGRYCRGCH